MEARILGAVLRAESKVQCRFNTAFLSMSQLGTSPVPWPSALPRVDLPKATSSCLFDTRPPSLCTGHAAFNLHYCYAQNY